MAPFNTHFLIAEKIWPDLSTGPWAAHYGQFCFGCVAPDVDKASSVLTQKDTHFFDRFGDYEAMASQRTAAFIAQQADFLRHPFAELPAEAQAFVLGYLCHLCVDEVSKHLWRRETWLKFHHVRPTSAFAALDELAWRCIQDYAAITRAFCEIEALPVIRHIALTDLEWMHQGVCRFVQAKSVEDEYLALVDMFDRPSATKRREVAARFRREIDAAREQVRFFQLEILVEAGALRSRERLADLIAERVPEPSYPCINEKTR